MIQSSNYLKNFFQIHIGCDEEIGKLCPTGLILDGVIINNIDLSLIIDKNSNKNAKIIKILNNSAFVIFDIEIKMFLEKISFQLQIHRYDFYSIFLNDSLSFKIINEFQQQSAQIIYSNSNRFEKYFANITYFCFNYDSNIFNLVEKLENKDRIIEISILRSQPNLFFFSTSNYTKLLEIYSELIQNDIWPIYSFRTKFSQLIHKEIIYESNIQFTKKFSKNFPIFTPEKCLFYIGFIEPIIKKHERIKNCNKLYDIYDISDIQISSIYTENKKSILSEVKTTRTFLGFDDQFRCLHAFDYFNKKASIFDVFLLKKQEFSINFHIKHNLYYIEVPNIFFNTEQSKNKRTIDFSVLYSIDSNDFFNDLNNFSSFFGFNNEQSFLNAKKIFSKLKGLRKINRIRMIEPDDYHSFFDVETSNILFESNLSYLIFNLKVKNNKISKDFQYKNAKKVIPDVLCQLDCKHYTIVGLENNEEREKLFYSLKNSNYSKKVVKSFYPETVKRSKQNQMVNDNSNQQTNIVVDFVPIIRPKSTDQKNPVDFESKLNSTEKIESSQKQPIIKEFTHKLIESNKPTLNSQNEKLSLKRPQNNSIFESKTQNQSKFLNDEKEESMIVSLPQSLLQEQKESTNKKPSQILHDEKTTNNSLIKDESTIDGSHQILQDEKTKTKSDSFSQILQDEKAKSNQNEKSSSSQQKSFSKLLEEASKEKGKSAPESELSQNDSNLDLYDFNDSQPTQENSTIETTNSKSSPSSQKQHQSSSEFQRNPNIHDFIPLPNLHYIYIEEFDPKPYSSQSSNAHIFGIDSIDDVQRFYYMPKTDKICTFLGFEDREMAEEAKSNPNFKSTKNKKPLDYKPQIKVQIPNNSSSLKIISMNSKAEKTNSNNATEPKPLNSNQPTNPDTKPALPSRQCQQTEIKRPQKKSPINISAPEQKKKTTIENKTSTNQQSSNQAPQIPSFTPISVTQKPSPPVIMFTPKKQSSDVLKKSSSSVSENSDKKPLSSSSSSEISVKKPSSSPSEISIKKPSSSSSEFSIKPAMLNSKNSIPIKSSSSAPFNPKNVTEFEIKKPSQSIKINSSSSTGNNNQDIENSPYFSPKPNLLYFYFSEATKSSLTILEGKKQNSLFGVHSKDTQRFVKHPTKNDHILYTFFGFDTKEEREKGILKIKSLGIKLNSSVFKFELTEDDDDNDDDVTKKDQNPDIHIKNHSPSKIQINELTVELYDLSISKEMREAISKAIFEKNLKQNMQTGVINTKDQNIIQTVYSSQSPEVIDAINNIVKQIICNDFNIRYLEELKNCSFLYFDEIFVPKKILNPFICYLKTIPGICNIQRNVFYQNKIASFFYYQKADKKTIINSIKNFFIKNDLLFDKREFLLKNTIIINEDLILHSKEDFETIIDQIKKIDIKITNIERDKLFVYESHGLNKLFQKFSFICFENEKDKTIALNHINQIAFRGKENTLKCDFNLHYAKIQDISFSPQMKENIKYLYDTIPNLVIKKKRLLSIENPIESTYLGFKSIRSLNLGIALLKFRLLLLKNNQKLLFFKPKRKTKYIRMHQEVYNNICNNNLIKSLKLIFQNDYQPMCQELEDGTLKSFAYIGFVDLKNYNKIINELTRLHEKNSFYEFQEVDNDINNEYENEMLIDVDEMCFFDGMF